MGPCFPEWIKADSILIRSCTQCDRLFTLLVLVNFEIPLTNAIDLCVNIAPIEKLLSKTYFYSYIYIQLLMLAYPIIFQTLVSIYFRNYVTDMDPVFLWRMFCFYVLSNYFYLVKPAVHYF